MTRYIDADTLYVKVKAECNPYGKPTISFDDGCKVLDMIRRTPTADVVPVVHAHWEYVKSTNYAWDYPWMCSECGSCSQWETDYCKDCGATMDEEV